MPLGAVGRVGLVCLCDRHAVGAAARHGLDFVRAGDGHDKLKNLVAVLRGKLLAVHKQRDAGLVGVDLDFGLALRAVDVAASAEMHKRVAAQICLIDKVGVLLRLAVEGHKTLLVLTGLAALTATVRAEVEAVPDVHAGNEESGHDAALQIAKDADLVICTLGGHYGWNASCTTGEGIDAMHIGLPVCQERFLEKLESLHKPVVGVHFDGHPISSDTADRVCNAILEAWAPGAQGGEAIAALLTGTANPCGKLPCTVARHEGQIPVYYNHPTNTCYSMTGGTPKNAYIDGAHTPRYCFGHGLSYTKYEYDTLRLEKDVIQADGVLKGRLHVRNAGNKAGTEIVQFYVHDVAASMVRPVKELVGFAKVNLQPGEEKTVCLSLPMSQLAFLDADMRWKVEHGKVELMVGASSEDIRGKAEFMIVGDAYPDGKNRSFVADTKIM